MKPLSECTTPRKLICPISRHFFPVEQPEPVGCCTTGLKKGSRFPFIAHFLSSGFGVLRASATVLAGFSSAAILLAPAAVAAGLAASTLAVATEADPAGFLGMNASCGFAVAVEVAVTGAAATGLAATACTLAVAAGAFAEAAAGAFFATASVCSVKTKLLPGPGVNS